jgi:hypothetical protein
MRQRAAAPIGIAPAGEAGEGENVTRRGISRVATIGVCGAILALLPGRFVAEPTLLDSYAIRVETRAQSAASWFAPGGSEIGNPFWRPLFHALHEAADRLGAAFLGDGDRGLRLLALLSLGFAAYALVRFARELRLPRGVAGACALLFCLAPPAISTAGWPVAASWPLGIGCTLLAAGASLRHARGDSGRAFVRALLWTALGLMTSQAPWHLGPFFLLLCVLPPTAAAGARRRALLLAVPVATLLLIHASWLETAARPKSGTPDRALLLRAVGSLPRYLESGLGGDTVGGVRALAWAALAIVLAAAIHDRRRRFLALEFLLAPLPFAVAGYSDRYALLTTALGLLAFAAAAPVVIATLSRGASRRRRWLPAGAMALVFLVQSRPRLFLLEAANDESARIIGAVRAAGDALLDAPAALLINAPPYLLEAVQALRLGRVRIARVRGEAPRIAPGFAPPVHALCTKDGYFSLDPPDATTTQGALPFEWDGQALVPRDPAAPFGPRRELPVAFLASGFEVLTAPTPAHPVLLPFAREEAATARTRGLEEPMSNALLERPLEGLVEPLPTERLDWRVEPLSAEDGRGAAQFDQQLVATIDVPRPALLVVGVTWLGPPDPLRFIVGSARRWCDLFRAELDGKPARIEPVYGHACGIVVPAGRHQVVVRGR